MVHRPPGIYHVPSCSLPASGPPRRTLRRPPRSRVVQPPHQVLRQPAAGGPDAAALLGAAPRRQVELGPPHCVVRLMASAHAGRQDHTTAAGAPPTLASAALCAATAWPTSSPKQHLQRSSAQRQRLRRWPAGDRRRGELPASVHPRLQCRVSRHVRAGSLYSAFACHERAAAPGADQPNYDGCTVGEVLRLDG